MKKIKGVESCGVVHSLKRGTLEVFPVWGNEVNDDGNWEALGLATDGTIYMVTLYTTDEWDEKTDEEKDNTNYEWSAQFDLEKSICKAEPFDDIFDEYEVCEE